jgi:hypothetical protein
MIPIVFWASFVPCVKATKPPETSWRRRNRRFTRLGECLRMIQSTTTMRIAATAKPRNGATRDGSSTLSKSPSHLITSQPEAATAEPATPPIKA